MTPSTAAYGAAARQPFALIVLLVAIAAGLTVAWWLFPLGLLAYALMVYLAARDPRLIALAATPSRPRLSSQTFRRHLETIERTEREIGRSVAQAGGPLGRLLEPVAQQARELTQEAYTLCQKGQIIESYLATVQPKELAERLRAVEVQISATADPYTRQQLDETRQALIEKQQNARDLQTFVSRIVAQLQNIAASLDNVLAETVRLRTADAVSAGSATNQVAQRLSDLKTDMDAFQQVLDTAITQSGAA